MPIVSIIVPVYNVEAYLKNCISSILSQTFTNLELILVNDGSTDLSGIICSEMALQDERIRVINIENGGVSRARNIGIKNARGKYIQFVDSDDSIDANLTERLVSCASLHEDKVIISGYRMVGESIIDFNKPFFGGGKAVFNKKEFADNFGFFLCEINYTNSPWNKLYKKSILEKNNICFQEGLSYGEDLLFNLKYFDCVNGAVVIFEVLYNYMQREEYYSLEAKFKRGLYENQIALYDEIETFLRNNGEYNVNNKKYLATYLAFRIMYCLKNLFHKDSDYSTLEREEIIKEIISNPRILAAFDECISDIPREFKNFPNYAKDQNIAGVLGLIDPSQYRDNGEKGGSLIGKVVTSISEKGLIDTIKLILKKIFSKEL